MVLRYLFIAEANGFLLFAENMSDSLNQVINVQLKETRQKNKKGGTEKFNFKICLKHPSHLII